MSDCCEIFLHSQSPEGCICQLKALLNVLADIWKYLKDECFPPPKKLFLFLSCFLLLSCACESPNLTLFYLNNSFFMMALRDSNALQSKKAPANRKRLQKHTQTKVGSWIKHNGNFTNISQKARNAKNDTEMCLKKRGRFISLVKEKKMQDKVFFNRIMHNLISAGAGSTLRLMSPEVWMFTLH